MQEALRRAKIRPDRKRGQNFLTDDNVLAAIIRAADLEPTDHVLEIGPGLGTLTRSLAARCAWVYAFEIDDKLVKYLTQWVLPEVHNIDLRDQAFNKYMLEQVLESVDKAGVQLKIVTNLPYQISAAFLHTVVEYRNRIERAVVMLQREVALRVIASAGDEEYSSFSLFLQAHLDTRWIADVPRSAFTPAPKVQSAVLRLKPGGIQAGADPQVFVAYLDLVERTFKHRRKQLSNAVRLAYSHLTQEQVDALLESANVDGTLRPQDVTGEQFMAIAAGMVEFSRKDSAD